MKFKNVEWLLFCVVLAFRVYMDNVLVKLTVEDVIFSKWMERVENN